MPIEPFDDNTFVAYLDVSGFKEMMADDQRAVRALDRFYQAGYDTLRTHRDVPRVDGLFVSDCGVLFVRSAGTEPAVDLRILLDSIEAIKRAVLPDDVMLTTTIAYGGFCYHDRVEFPGIEKNPIYGNAYVAAFLDNERGAPRIQPGQCRISRQHEPDTVDTAIRDLSSPRIRAHGAKHSYFFWMVVDDSQIAPFEREYRDAYSLKYRGMLHALRVAAGRPGTLMREEGRGA